MANAQQTAKITAHVSANAQQPTTLLKYMLMLNSQQYCSCLCKCSTANNSAQIYANAQQPTTLLKSMLVVNKQPTILLQSLLMLNSQQHCSNLYLWSTSSQHDCSSWTRAVNLPCYAVHCGI